MMFFVVVQSVLTSISNLTLFNGNAVVSNEQEVRMKIKKKL